MSSRVGAQFLPIPSGENDSKIPDPAIAGIIDYMAYSIVQDFGAKGVEQSTEVAHVLPTANRFPFDPGQHWTRNGTPALYLWWPKGTRSRITQFSALRWTRERELRLFYTHCEVTAPDESEVYAGLTQAIDAILARASRRPHPSYSYNGSVPGTPIARVLAPEGDLSWQYEGGYPDFAAAVPSVESRFPGGATPGAGEQVRGYPVLFGTVRLWERVTDDDPTELLGDSPMTITTDGADILSHVLPAPDGTEFEDE
jgi:hypothetical protein